jgi:mRNA interferase MazF
LKRGDLVTVSLPGAYGKPRPALVVQADLFAGHSSITILPITSELVDAPLLRPNVLPDGRNGLEKPSQIMIDKIHTLPRDKVGKPFGSLEGPAMMEVTRRLAFFLGLA